MVFEIWKPACLLCATFVLTIIMYSDIWSLVEMECWSVQHWTQQWNCLSKWRRLQLHSVVSISSFKDVMLLAAILCYCGYWKGIKKDQWRRVNHKDVHFQYPHLTMWSKEEMPCSEVHAGQLGSKLSHVAWTNAAFAEFSTRICIMIHTKCKLLRNLVNGTRWADYSFALSSWTWWKTRVT